MKASDLTEVFQVIAGDKLVVIVHRALGALLELLCQVVKEGAPPRGRTQSLNTHGHLVTPKITNFLWPCCYLT